MENHHTMPLRSPHDRGVRQAVEDLPRGLQRIDLLDFLGDFGG